MGEDIHQRIYVKTRSSGKYINAHEMCEWDPKYSMFKEIIPDRNYDIFSLFGSSRGRYPELSNANYGLPEFLKNTEFDEYCRKCGFYGFIWFKATELYSAVCKYIKTLDNPLEFAKLQDRDEAIFYPPEPGKQSQTMLEIQNAANIINTTDTVTVPGVFNFSELLKPGQKTENDIQLILTGYQMYLTEHQHIFRFLHELRSELEPMLHMSECDTGYDELIDAPETIYLFFFDN